MGWDSIPGAAEPVNLNEAPFAVFTECPPLDGRVG